MALLDPKQQCIVLRTIYDGPAYAGKTTNLQVLAQRLGTKIYSGEEADGRTLYFDWVDYVGGLFEGMPIRCQIVSVPGQQVLDGRRRLLLETADVVVFVADSRPEQMEENIRSFAGLRQAMEGTEPPVGIVVQANKRDIEDAVSLDTLRDTLGGESSLAMTEAVASSGDGVRETFVLSVRLALDRVRALWDRNALPKLTPDIDNGPQLLSALQEAEQGEIAGLVSLGQGEPDRRSSSHPIITPQPQTLSSQEASSSPSTKGPPFPDASVPPGLVWPPVEGRVVVHEASRVTKHLERTQGGDWVGLSNEWSLRAPLEGLFFDLIAARAALVDWARWHVTAGARLSSPRSIVLVPETNEVWRLWQIVGRVPTLQDELRELFKQPDDSLLGEGLYRIIDLRLRAETEFVAGGWLGRLSLDSVGSSDMDQLFFTGFSPYPSGASSHPADTEFDQERLFRNELAPVVRRELGQTPRRLPAVLERLQQTAAAHRRGDIAESIQHILLGS